MSVIIVTLLIHCRHGHFSGINRKVQFKQLSGGSNHSQPPHSHMSNKGQRCYLCPVHRNEGSILSGPQTTQLLLILKWGGELTSVGQRQAEELGRAFRCMYPGGEGEYASLPGSGFLRLHSTYRHDLKVYASDEGRVQMTAAAFTKVSIACLYRYYTLEHWWSWLPGTLGHWWALLPGTSEHWWAWLPGTSEHCWAWLPGTSEHCWAWLPGTSEHCWAWLPGTSEHWWAWLPGTSEHWWAWLPGTSEHWWSWLPGTSEHWWAWLPGTSEHWVGMVTWYIRTLVGMVTWYIRTLLGMVTWYIRTLVGMVTWYIRTLVGMVTWYIRTLVGMVTWYIRILVGMVTWYIRTLVGMVTWYIRTLVGIVTWYMVVGTLQGLLELEGNLASVLVHLVKRDDVATAMLDVSCANVEEVLAEVKERLHTTLKSSEDVTDSTIAKVCVVCVSTCKCVCVQVCV